MKITDETVRYAAALAKLTISEDDMEKAAKDLDHILEYIETMNGLDTEGVEPTGQTTGLSNVYRNDEVKLDCQLTSDQALSGTDNTHNGFFKVPAILEGRTDK